MIASMRPAEGIDWISRRRVGRGNTGKQLGNLNSLFNSAPPEFSDTSELAEEDVWGTLSSSPVNSPSSSRSRAESSPSPKAAAGSRLASTSQMISYAESRESSGYGRQLVAPRSAPVKVPDWTKLHEGSDEDANESEDDREERLPPHEIVARELAREPTTAFSVFEGAGRKLKGRELNNVRNAVWKHTGFFG